MEEKYTKGALKSEGGEMGQQAQHTPGPWEYNAYHGKPEDLALMKKHGMEPAQALTNEGQRFIMAGEEGSDNYKRVALVDCQTIYKRGKGHQTECDERDANARLIVTAPAMSLALQMIAIGIARIECAGTLQEFCFDGLRHIMNDDWNALLSVIGWDRARAAIAKATGDES